MQTELKNWRNTTFPPRDETLTRLVGDFSYKVLEEIVPILHIVRQTGTITHEQVQQFSNTSGLQFSIGNIILFLLDYCESRQWSLQEIVEQTWDSVQKRKWIENENNALMKYEGQKENE